MIFEFDCVVCGMHCRKDRSPTNTFSTPKYCSQKCNGIARKGVLLGERASRIEFACAQCGKEVSVYRSPSQIEKQPPKYCSVKCTGLSQTGVDNPAYAGGRFIGANGYAYVLSFDHPNKDVRGYVLEHRLVAEASIGRLLTDVEVVHHKDRDKLNNRPNNLQIMCDQAAHVKLHREEDEQRKYNQCIEPSS
jgi:hypothetical protein